MKKTIEISVFFFFFSCGGSKQEQIPVGVLAKDKMVKILSDIQLAEGELTFNNSQTIIDPAADTISYSVIFANNKIKKADYDSSMKYYTLHPELLNEIYDEVINKLEHNKKQLAPDK